MKLRAVHLIRHVERVERDLEELRRLEQSLKEDRGYAVRLRDSLIDETMRLEQIKSRIMSQVVKAPVDLPAEDPVERQLAAIEAGTRKAELVIPAQAGRSEKPIEEKRPARVREEKKAAAESGKKRSAFDFKYD
ncbi:MAG: hypothetical protein JNM27_08910 [Leptospirales bacterium]|nr:hypothetical protein [Leptospirales bacterium]